MSEIQETPFVSVQFFAWIAGVTYNNLYILPLFFRQHLEKPLDSFSREQKITSLHVALERLTLFSMIQKSLGRLSL